MLAPTDMPPPRPRQEPRVVIEPWPVVTHRAREQRSEYDDYTWPEGQPSRPMSRREKATVILAAVATAWAILIFGGAYVRAAFRSAPAPVAMPPATISQHGVVGADAVPTSAVR